MTHHGFLDREDSCALRVQLFFPLIMTALLLNACAPRSQSAGSPASQTSHYEASMTMRVATEMYWNKAPDFPGFLPLDIVMRNTAKKAICFPLDLAPFPKGYVNEVFQVWETETGVEVPRVVKGFVTESSDMHNNVRIIPPGEGTRFIARLSNGFDLIPGTEYRVLYDVEGYFCDAFDRGYPHTEAAYIEQEKSELSFFDRTPSTVVKFKAELVFEVE